MVEKIRENLYKIPVALPNSPLRLLNSYVLTSSQRNLIIDTGFRRRECLDSLSEGLRELNIDMANTDILLTHLHADHTGLAPDIASPTSKVYISREEIPWMLKTKRGDIQARDRLGFVRLGFSEEELTLHNKSVAWDLASSDEFTDYLPIDDGDVFTCGDYELRAVKTPGHTPGHMCFWLEKEKIMLTGDHVLFDISPNITNWLSLHDTLGSYLDSLRMIDKYDVELALPGHRETGDFHARIALLLEHHAIRLEECENIIKANPGLTTYEITGRMQWKIRSKSWEDFPIGQKWFAVGECYSHLRHLEVIESIMIDKNVTPYKVYPL